MTPIPVRFLDVRNLPKTGEDPPLSAYDYLLSPASVHVRLSAKCQYDCVFCERESWKYADKEPEKDMPEAVWNLVKEKFLPHVKGVEVCGLGEPTLSPLFPKVCRDILDAGKTLYFPTNGVSLGSKKIMDAVGDTPRVSVSLDAWDDESYKRVRGGDWKKVVSAVKKFRAAKPEAFLHSQFTAGTYNIDGLPQFMAAAADMGIQEVILRFVQAHTVAREDVSLRFAKDRTESAIIAASQIASERGIWFTAERRPYAEDEYVANSAGDDGEEAQALRYLSFVPMDAVNCAGGSSNGSNNPSGGSNTTGGTFTFTYGDTTVTLIDPNAVTESPEVIRTIKVPRKPSEYAAQSVDGGGVDNKPVVVTDAASIIIWDDGELTSCFAKHHIGDVHTDTLDSVVSNPRYQAFLQNRANGRVLQENWCAHCPRNF
jgi:MoaA/NifB/PqqE/SkfB family radical SAM enzyme